MNSAENDNENEQHATLLFVDDEENILNSLKRLFRPMQYRIFTATSGQEGLTILAKEHVDLVISDMRMPEMDGSAFLAAVAQQWPSTVRILLTGYADIGSTIEAINKGNIYRYISKPWEDNDIKLTVQHAIKTKQLEKEKNELSEKVIVQNKQLKTLNTELEDKVKQRTKELEQTLSKLKLVHDSLKKQYISTVKIFTNLIEMRVGTAPGHFRRVADLARDIATDAGLDADQLQNITFAALLLDIGKIGLPDNLLNIPYDKVANLDRPKYEKYPIMGEASLMALEPLHTAAKIIRNHTENYNGSGFPDRLKGDEIPIGSRIIALANDYELLISGSLLPRRLTPNEAKSYITRQRGKRYDPALVDTLFPRVSDVTIDNKKEDSYFTTPKQLKSGMIVSRDFILPNGMVLLARGQTLNENFIDKIQALESSMDERFRVFIKNTEK